MEPKNKSFTVKLATVDDGERILDLYTSVVPDWPTDAFYVTLILKVFPGAIFIAVDETDAILGAIMGIPFDDDQATVSNLVVRHDMRKKGLGAELMRAVNLVRGERNVSVLSVLDMIPNYEQYGLHSTGAMQTVCNGVRASNFTSISDDVNAKGEEITVRNKDEPGVKEAVMEYDRTVFPIGRDSFVETFMFGHPAAHIKVAFIGDRIVGYSYLREANEKCPYYMPVLYGDSNEVANVLLAELMQFIPEGGKISISARIDNTHAIKLLRQIVDIECEIPCIEMVMFFPLNLGWDKTYFRHYCDCALI